MKSVIVQGAGQTPIYRVLVIAGSVRARRIGRKSPNGSPRSAEMSWAENLRSLISDWPLPNE
jgi:hypothetical protein